jgi:hypothetical protein
LRNRGAKLVLTDLDKAELTALGRSTSAYNENLDEH